MQKAYQTFPDLKWVLILVLAQFIISVIASFLFWILKGYLYGLSGMLGGLIAILPELMFLRVFFKNRMQRHAKQVVVAFYLAEVVKWIMTLGLFTCSFQWSKLKVVALFLTFIATQLAYWLILIYEHGSRIYSTSFRTSGNDHSLGNT